MGTVGELLNLQSLVLQLFVLLGDVLLVTTILDCLSFTRRGGSFSTFWSTCIETEVVNDVTTGKVVLMLDIEGQVVGHTHEGLVEVPVLAAAWDAQELIILE